MKAILETKIYYRDYTNMTRAEKIYRIKRLKPINKEDTRCLKLLLENEIQKG